MRNHHEMYIPFRRWLETILWILCRGLESTTGTMLYPQIGVKIFNSLFKQMWVTSEVEKRSFYNIYEFPYFLYMILEIEIY